MKSLLSIIPHSGHVESGEFQKIKLEVIAKYRRELAGASWWRRWFLYLKIEQETRRVIRSRI